MKRLLAVFLISLMALSALDGCKKPTESADPSSAVKFEKPQESAAVLSLSVNPLFFLYLDAEGRVLAVEPKNEDAKTILDGSNWENLSLQEAADALARAMIEGGFLKEGAEITLSLVEQKEGVDPSALLAGAKAAVEAGFSALEVSAEVKVEGESRSSDPKEESATSKEPEQKPAEKKEDLPKDANLIAEDPQKVEITKNPTKLVYYEGEAFNTDGMEAIAYYKGGATRRLGPGEPTYSCAYEGQKYMEVAWVLGDGLSLYTAKVPITVKPALFKIAEDQDRSPFEMKEGETLQLTGIFLQGASGTVRWRSNHEEIAAVDANGMVTALKAGTAYIYATATIGGAEYGTFPCKIEVSEIPEEAPPAEPSYLDKEYEDWTAEEQQDFFDNGGDPADLC